jgi:hypothetical protein
VSHVDKVLLTVLELSVVSGCNKSNMSGVTRGQFRNGKQYLVHG